MNLSELEATLLSASLTGCRWPPILDARQASACLGCSKEYLESLAARGEVPAVKIGRGWIFTAAQLLLHVAASASANFRYHHGQNRGEDPPDRADVGTGTISLVSQSQETSSKPHESARDKGAAPESRRLIFGFEVRRAGVALAPHMVALMVSSKFLRNL